MDPRIEEYIRTNRRKYTREAITKQLEEAGHDRAAIDATWAAFDARDPDETVGEAFWGRFLLFLLVSNAAALLLVGLLIVHFIRRLRSGAYRLPIPEPAIARGG